MNIFGAVSQILPRYCRHEAGMRWKDGQNSARAGRGRPNLWVFGALWQMH